MTEIDLALFVYGTLRDREILEGVLGRAVPPADRVDARAYGWRTVYYPDRLYPALVPANQWTLGLMIAGLGQRDMARLDAFEGDEYRRGMIEIETQGGTGTAQTYFPTKTINTDAPRWTFETWTALHRPQAIAQYRSDDFAS
tara:strand:- start:544 stop:969 length:426 start_codon:yes stop_codon:yes gene_type:complete